METMTPTRLALTVESSECRSNPHVRIATGLFQQQRCTAFQHARDQQWSTSNEVSQYGDSATENDSYVYLAAPMLRIQRCTK
jgi:hypothetical protein